MKDTYLDIMERVVDVYTPERFDAYIQKTNAEGITEHGFPRLCANIGILMAHGRAKHLRHRFEEMMIICCRDIPDCSNRKNKRGNDFSVREVLSAILELENAKLYPPETIALWKDAIAKVDPYTCYRMVAPTPPVAVDNWASFNAAGEQLRCKAGLANTERYIENQIASQMHCFDESGMYRDPNDPMVYDLVGRNMLSACLHHGYNGKYASALRKHLLNAAEMTLFMQSTTGELAYGGRSNQFIHNEAHMAACFEFAAAEAFRLGQHEKAARYKAAANYALACIVKWMQDAPGHHIKNYYPNDSMVGCEDYAYYDKYMVTVASFLYLAYQFCDDTILPSISPAEDDSCFSFQTPEVFRKLFCKAGSYFLEAEVCSDQHYDAEGIGRVQRRGAPSTICISVPAPKAPNYRLERPNEMPLSICCGKLHGDQWEYAFDAGAKNQISSHNASENQSNGEIHHVLPSGESLTTSISVTQNGVTLTVTGEGTVGITLPAFFFDGKEHTNISYTTHKLAVTYKNWICSYETSKTLDGLAITCGNRNGQYQVFRAVGNHSVTVHISIEKAS